MLGGYAYVWPVMGGMKWPATYTRHFVLRTRLPPALWSPFLSTCDVVMLVNLQNSNNNGHLKLFSHIK